MAEVATRIADLMSKADALRLSAIQLTSFAHLLLYPESTRRRIKESMDLREQLVTKTASAEITRELHSATSGDLEATLAKDEGRLFVPIMRPLKKRLITGLSVHDRSGASIATLSHEESMIFLTKLLKRLFVDTFNLSADHRDWSKDQGALFVAIMEVALRVPPDDIADSVSRSLERDRSTAVVADLLAETKLVIVDDRAHERIRALIRLLALNYVIIGEHEPAERFFVQYSYRVPKKPFHRQRDLGFRASIKGLTRGLLRSDASYLQIPVNKAKRCDSYHLVITAPNGTHFGRAVLKDEQGESVTKASGRGFNGGSGYFRISERGYQEAHFYSRQLWKSPSAAYLDVRIQETPPGRLGRAALAAAITLPLLYLVARSAQGKTTSAELNLDHAAILAAGLPTAIAILAFVLGTTAPDSRVLAILAVPSALMTAAVILVGATRLMSPPGITDEYRDAAHFDFFGVYAHDWIILCVAATLNLLVTTCALGTRLLRHDNLRAKSSASYDVEALVSR